MISSGIRLFIENSVDHSLGSHTFQTYQSMKVVQKIQKIRNRTVNENEIKRKFNVDIIFRKVKAEARNILCNKLDFFVSVEKPSETFFVANSCDC